MSISFFNDQLLSDFPVSVNELQNIIFSVFLDEQLPAKVNIIFVDKEEVLELNSTYRKKDEVTDVLSFNIDSEIAEVYICLEYIKEGYKENLVEEIIRTIIHGLLHIQGYDHKEKFKELVDDSEEMFKIQEDKVKQVMQQLK